MEVISLNFTLIFLISTFLTGIFAIPLVPLVVTLIIAKFAFKADWWKNVGIGLLCNVGIVVILSIFTVFSLFAGVLTNPATWCDHQYEIVEEFESTCTQKGELRRKCTECGQNSVEYFDKLPHTWSVESVVIATCTSEGYTLVKCTACSATERQNASSSLGHSMKEISRTEPTRETEGSIVFGCERCSYEETQTIDKISPLPDADGDLPEIEDLINELMALGFTQEEAKVCREIFLKCGVTSIKGAEASSSTATIDDLIAYRIVMDGKRTLTFTIDHRELFYIALNGTDVYDTSKGGFLITIDDVYIPESEISRQTAEELEDLTILVLDPYFINALWYDGFSFGRSDDVYAVRCEVYARNRLGVEEWVPAKVWYEYNGADFVVTRIVIDGVRYK